MRACVASVCIALPIFGGMKMIEYRPSNATRHINGMKMLTYCPTTPQVQRDCSRIIRSNNWLTHRYIQTLHTGHSHHVVRAHQSHEAEPHKATWSLSTLLGVLVSDDAAKDNGSHNNTGSSSIVSCTIQ